jgi:hypothetical protein
MLLSAGMVAYLGAFPGDWRQTTLAGWVQVRPVPICQPYCLGTE